MAMTKNAGDIAASGATVVTAMSQWAEVLTPILALMIAVLTLAWWAWRFWDKVRGKAVADE